MSAIPDGLPLCTKREVAGQLARPRGAGRVRIRRYRTACWRAAGWCIAGRLAVVQLRGVPKQGLPLVPAREERASKGAAPRLVHQPGGRRFSVDLDLLGVEGEGGEDVAVLPSALGRGGADVALRPGVVREVKRAWRQTRARLVAGAGGQLGDVGGNVHHGPVPEAEDRGRFGVNHGDDEALRPRGKAAPGQLWGRVLAAGAEDAADLGHRQLLALLQVAAGQ